MKQRVITGGFLGVAMLLILGVSFLQPLFFLLAVFSLFFFCHQELYHVFKGFHLSLPNKLERLSFLDEVMGERKRREKIYVLFFLYPVWCALLLLLCFALFFVFLPKSSLSIFFLTLFHDPIFWLSLLALSLLVLFPLFSTLLYRKMTWIFSFQVLWFFCYLVLPLLSLLSFFLNLQSIMGGRKLFFSFFSLFLVATWGTDISAYFTGYFFGKKKIVPHISPKKTWAGFWGGLFASLLVYLLYAIFLSPYFLYGVTDLSKIEKIFGFWAFLFLFLGLGILQGILVQLGDWLASYIKRLAQVKDFSNLFPGHGGFLDRFDGILFAWLFMPIFLNLFLFIQ